MFSTFGVDLPFVFSLCYLVGLRAVDKEVGFRETVRGASVGGEERKVKRGNRDMKNT